MDKVAPVLRHIGRHELWIEEDVVCARFIGAYLPDHAQQILTLSDELFRKYGKVFLLADVSQADVPGPKTRIVVATWPYLGRYGTVMFGASLTIRAIISLMISAQRLLGRHPSFLTHLAANEAEARAWISEQRRIHDKK